MRKKLVIPKFSSEAEDAAWHDAHKAELEDEFIRQMKAGTAIVARKGEPLSSVLERLRNLRQSGDET